MLRDDTVEALTNKLEQQEARMESFVAQIDKLNFDTDVLNTRRLQVGTSTGTVLVRFAFVGSWEY